MQYTSDLRLVASQLDGKKPYSNFVSFVNRVHGITSAGIDLRSAISSFEILSEKFIMMDRPDEYGQDPEQAHLGMALFCHGVVFYCRAMGTTGKGRWRSGIEQSLPIEMRYAHKEIMNLRNEAIAHFGGGGDHWSLDGLVLIVSGDDQTIKSPFTRYNYRGDQVLRYLELTQAAIKVSENITQDRFAELHKEILRLTREDQKFRELITSSEFDPRSVFVSEAACTQWAEEMKNSPNMPAISSPSMRQSAARIFPTDSRSS